MNNVIRPETTSDHETIRHVHRLAFGQDTEGQLVDALRVGNFVQLSLVAEAVGQIVGHILFSELPITTKDGETLALALAPLAVLPTFQNQGIGSSLVRRGLDECRHRGHRIVVVVGHPRFYQRFGFSSKPAAQLESPFAGETFMAIELAAGVLNEIRGRVTYPPPFSSWTKNENNDHRSEATRVRVLLPQHLRTLARVSGEVALDLVGPATVDSVLDALESQYPMLRGTIRDHTTKRRRPFIRFFACEQDLSHDATDTPLPAAVASGIEPLLIVGAMAGG